MSRSGVSKGQPNTQAFSKRCLGLVVARFLDEPLALTIMGPFSFFCLEELFALRIGPFRCQPFLFQIELAQFTLLHRLIVGVAQYAEMTKFSEVGASPTKLSC